MSGNPRATGKSKNGEAARQAGMRAVQVAERQAEAALFGLFVQQFANKRLKKVVASIPESTVVGRSGKMSVSICLMGGFTLETSAVGRPNGRRRSFRALPGTMIAECFGVRDEYVMINRQSSKGG